MNIPKESSMFEARPYLLKNKIQHYAWGMRGEKAFIPRLLGFAPDPDVPYAELWIGAHPKAPSTIDVNGHDEPLDKIIEKFPQQILGTQASRKEHGKLQFLLKVLSAGEALSIQAHPNKEQAEYLHAKDPLNYPDDNHKPEIAIALDSLRALIGFKPFESIQRVLQEYPEISNFVGAEIVEGFLNYCGGKAEQQKNLLKELFASLMHRSVNYASELGLACQSLAKRLESQKTNLQEQDILFLDLFKKYKSDIGLFSIYLMNLITLTTGEGVFLEAGVPHAYLHGNIVECMANSDNVVRAGLTPKFQDVDALVNILTYEMGHVSILAADTTKFVYKTPEVEFQISRFMLQKGSANYNFNGEKVRVFLLIDGQGIVKLEGKQFTFECGQSLLIPACLKSFKIDWQTPATLFVAQES